MPLIHCNTSYTKLKQIILQSRDLAEDIDGVANFRDSSYMSFSTMTKCVVTSQGYCSLNTMTLKICGHHPELLHFKNNDTKNVWSPPWTISL